ncbi:class I SAM-dependent methyltransferase [Entomomonas asaccharolytica]|uniref:Ribosomal RNA small subunit methyltransferase C n=1 Tax=Entomomonas asaccharolytica TaxID=2785331 RepID=A0A974RVU9_9GAMM|nr:class I SAM-dependent methyltransferase [Entomomonas asaccharolytica]QQP84561.1 class I SAM-dependent methyltransferase [Entomomonas asaccharolytica]
MDPRSEVLLRQAELFNGTTLLAGLPADELLSKLPQATGWTWLASDWQMLSHHYQQRIHLATSAPASKFQTTVLFLSKSKELTEYLLQALAASTEQQGLLYLVGEKKAGIERAAKQLAHYGKTRKLDSARHCQLWQVQINEAISAPQLADFAQSYTVNNLTISSFAGVFSHGHLDKGSQLLIQHLDKIPAGKILDFGCGAGVIGALLKQRYPQSTVYLQDVDVFAIASSEQTLNNNNLQAITITGDGIAASPKGLTAIITNPPFHQGIQTNYQTTEQLLHYAIDHLVKGGELRLVANSFLKYQPLIEQTFGNCQILAESNGFKIYRACKV